MRVKTNELENRREKLKKLLDSENQQYAKEIEGKIQILLILINLICTNDCEKFSFLQNYQSPKRVAYQQKH